MQSELKTDWTTKMSAHTSSSAYARQNGKPVVCIWGFGFNDPGRPFAPADLSRGGQLVQGTGLLRDRWRADLVAHRSERLAARLLRVYHAFHAISPWMVGRTGDLAGLDSYYNNVNLGDQADCNASGIDYLPCVMPGDLSSGARFHGDFMWRHFYNMVRLGSQGIYISMFDEYNEGNQIAKTAETPAMQPDQLRLRALDEDGVGLLVGLLPAHHQRRRPDAQGPHRPDRGPPHPADGRHPAADRR